MLFADGGKVNAWISADNITNNAGAEINSTVSDLTLSADNAFNNFGSINATGNCDDCGEYLIDEYGQHQCTATLEYGLSPSVTNSGSIASSGADVTFDAVASNMNINNLNGTISALNGAINIRESGYAESFNSTVNGGNLLSNELNVHSGAGTSDVFVNQLTGIVNADGTAAHVSADTDVLTIGKAMFDRRPNLFQYW